jgi:iron complex transport system ATP-binding protein
MVHTLSDGERQKVMIAKALAQQTPVIYLDEPTAFLDFPSKVEMMQLLHRLAVQEQIATPHADHRSGKTIFLSTHDVELALQIADCLWLMEPQGLSVGTPQELASQGVLSRFIERDGIAFDKDTLTIHVRR